MSNAVDPIYKDIPEMGAQEHFKLTLEWGHVTIQDALICAIVSSLEGFICIMVSPLLFEAYGDWDQPTEDHTPPPRTTDKSDSWTMPINTNITFVCACVTVISVFYQWISNRHTCTPSCSLPLLCERPTDSSIMACRGKTYTWRHNWQLFRSPVNQFFVQLA